MLRPLLIVVPGFYYACTRGQYRQSYSGTREIGIGRTFCISTQCFFMSNSIYFSQELCVFGTSFEQLALQCRDSIFLLPGDI